ncbi:MAG TPA: hypothetical protein VNV87_03385 [Acidimicrobiales bacterium]|nr:hypothetical protein [Acidimicrobiales bacterium]
MSSRLPLQIETIQTGNGAEFQSAFHWHVLGLDQRIGHNLHPATPHLNGTVCEDRTLVRSDQTDLT